MLDRQAVVYVANPHDYDMILLFTFQDRKIDSVMRKIDTVKTG